MPWTLPLTKKRSTCSLVPSPIASNLLITNYLGNSGRLPVDAALLAVAITTTADRANVDKYIGPFRFIIHKKIGDVTDGTSNTVLFGEVVAAFDTTTGQRLRSFAYSSSPLWMQHSFVTLAGAIKAQNQRLEAIQQHAYRY